MNSPYDFLRPIPTNDLVRIGSHNDGGYVIPLNLAMDSDLLLSFGISTDWSFEEAFSNLNPRCNILAYDHTVSINIFRKLALQSLFKLKISNAIQFFKLINSYDSFFNGGRVQHHKKKLSNNLKKAHHLTLNSIIQSNPNKNIFLKIDIEGDEYRVIEDICQNNTSICCIVIEFHEIEIFFKIFKPSIISLLNYFKIIHIHGNNYGGVTSDGFPDVVEITFVHKNVIDAGKRQYKFPIPDLDQPNNPKKPDIEFEFSTIE